MEIVDMKVVSSIHLVNLVNIYFYNPYKMCPQTKKLLQKFGTCKFSLF
jgi:hypothetical protein